MSHPKWLCNGQTDRHTEGPTKLFAAYEQIISPLSCLQNSSMILYSMILSYDRSRMVKEEFQSNYALSKAGGNDVTENSFFIQA